MATKILSKSNAVKGIFLLMCVTIIAANLNLSQAVKAAETVQDNKIKSGSKEPIVKSGSCENPTGWIENLKDSDTHTIAYFVKNENRRFSGTETPATAPEKYLSAMCSFGDRVNYKDSNGNLLRINNQFVKTIITRDLKDITEVVENGKLVQKESNKTIRDTYYINSGNDYVAKFPTDPNQGFYFKTNKLYDGAVFEVVKVSIGGKPLNANAPIVKNNIIVYPEVLPGVDLKYVLNTNGIAKYFEIKNAEAVMQNDLTSYAFDLANNTKLEKKDENKDKLKAILESKGITKESSPVLTKASEGIELISEIKQVTETKPVIAPTVPVLPLSPVSPILPVLPQAQLSTSSQSQLPTTQLPLAQSSSSSASASSSKSASTSSLPLASTSTVTASSSTASASSSSAISSSSQASSTPAKVEQLTIIQNKTDDEIQNAKEIVKTQIVKELDTKITKLEEIKKEEELKGDKKDTTLIELTVKTIDSTKSLTNEVKSNSINLANEKQTSTAIKGNEDTSSGTEKLIVPNLDDKISIGLPVIFDKDISKIKTIASSISQAKDKLTISVNKDYLIAKERQFPIIVDPSIEVKINQGLFDTAWVSRSNPNTNQNPGNKVRMIAGTPGKDNTNNWTDLGRTESFLSFGIPTGVHIIDAKLKIYVYQTSNNGVNLNVSGLTKGFSSDNITWNNGPGLAGNYGVIQIPNTQQPQNATMYQSSIIVDGKYAMPDMINTGVKSEGAFLFGLSSDNGYAWFCSSRAWEYDGDTAPCSNKIESTPKLEVIYTRPPGPAVPENFQNSNDIGQCDLSKPTGQNGKCDTVTYKRLDFSGVNSGDGNSENSKVISQTSNKNGMTVTAEDGNVQSQPFETANTNNDNRADYTTMGIGSGVFKNTFFNIDNWGIPSNPRTEYFQNDNGSPVAYSGINAYGVKATDGSYLIGRSNPQNTQPQVKFTVPDYMDATYNKFSVNPAWNNDQILDIAGGFNPIDFGGSNQGRPIGISGAKKFNLDAQVFAQDGKVIRANNSDFCWDTNRGDNNRLVIARCTGNENQRFAYDPVNKQFKLLDQEYEYGNITSLTSNFFAFNIHNASNDNQSELKMYFSGNRWNSNFRYNLTTQEIVNQYQKCLDTGNNTEGQNLRINDCHGGLNQKFVLDASNRLYNRQSNLCVDSAAGNKDGSRLYMYQCHNGDNQKFKVKVASESKEVTINNAVNCVEGIPSNNTLYVRPCSDNQFQKFDYSTEQIVRITAPGGRNEKGTTNNSAQLNGPVDGGGMKAGSHLSINSTGMEWQYTRYLNATKQIRSNEGLCLDYHIGNFRELYFAGCNDGNNQKWEEATTINGTKVLASVYKKDGNRICLTQDIVGDFNSFVYGSACVGSPKQEFSFENYQKYLFPSNEMKYQARISESIDGKTGATITIPWQSSSVFQFNSDQNLSQVYKYINNNTWTLKLEDGKSYFVSIQAKDRNTDVANISAWSEPSRIVIDTSLPVVSDLKTVIKGNQKSIDFNVLEKNFDTAYIDVYDINNVKVKTITKCNGILCKDIDTSIIKNLSFNLDGLGDNGKELSDGNYRIEPVVIDKSKNTNANSTQVGGTNTMASDINGVISKSPNILLISNSASIYIVNPSNKSWVNKDTIKIEGSAGRVNSIDVNGVSITKEIKQLDFTKLDLDGAGNLSTGTALEKLQFNVFNNFTKETKLDHGKNEFKFTNTDVNDNVNSKIGDNNTTRVDSWTVNREDIAPEIKSIKFNGNISIPTSIPTINDSKATIEFTALDNAEPLYSSGLYTGINPKGYDISLLRSIDDNKSFRELPLFRDGVNISDPNPNPRLAGDLKCEAISLEVKCNFTADNLKLDANYMLHLKVRDKANNEVCSRHYEYIEKALNAETKCNYIKPYTSVVPNYVSSPTREYTGYDLFKIKTFTYLNAIDSTNYEVLPPLQANTTTPTLTQVFTGFKSNSYTFDVEESAYLHFKNASNNRSIFIDPKSPAFPLETDITDTIPDFSKAKNYYRQAGATLLNVTSVCGTSIDHDLIAETPNIKTCKVTFGTLLNDKAILPATSADNQITIYAINGVNSNIYKTNAIIDYSKYVLNTSAATNTISPDGDGKFDTITFTNSHEYITKKRTLGTSDQVKYQIKDSSGKVILEPDMTKISQFNTYIFDGKANGKVLPDGQYIYSISMLSRKGDKSRVTSSETKFNIVSNITPAIAPIIITPAPNFTTTRGVITLQGNGVKSDPKNISNTWSVDVCARLSNKSLVNADIQAAIPANGCVYQSTVKTTATGFYTLLVTLPYANQSYDLEVKSTNPNGNQSSPVVNTKVIYNTPESIQDLTVTSSIEGLNTADQMKCAFGNAQTTTATIKCDTVNVNNLKTLKISTTVLKGVEGVELDFNDLTNLNALPTSDKNDYNSQYAVNNGKRIAIINDLTESNLKFNPNADTRVKKNQAGALILESSPIVGVSTGKDLSYGSMRKPCLLESCTWTYYYVLPYQMAGGKYEVRARTYKGESVQQATASFEVNGILKLAPKLIRAQKDVMSAKCQYVTTFDSNSADAKTCTAGGGGNTTESITLKSVNNDATGTGTNQTKIQTFYTNKQNVRAYIGGDLKNEFNYKLTNGVITVIDTKAITTDKGLAELNFNLGTGNGGNNQLIITPINVNTKQLNTAEATAYNIVYDNVAPALESVITTNKSTTASTPSINPWIRNGDQINFDIKTNGSETIDYGYVISESGYREPIKLINDGRSPGINSYQANLTIQREKLEGVYFPTIYLQDLAGNSSLVNNDVSKVLLNNIVNDNKPNLKKVNGNGNGSTGNTITYDFDQVAYTNINGGVNSSAVNGVINGIIYAPSTYPTTPINYSGLITADGRKASTDFSLLLDNTRPLRGDFNMIGIGDTVIEYDPLTNSPKIGSSLQSSNTTRTGAIRTDGVLASGINLGSGGNIPIGVNGNGMIEVDRLVGQKTNNPNNVGANKESTNQGYSLVTRNNLVELRISAERNTRLTLLLKEGKDSSATLGTENAYTLDQTITPSSTTIDNSSCTTNPTSISKLGVSRATGGTNQLFRLAGAKNGLYKPELQAAGTAGGTDKNMVLNSYDNNLIPMLSSDPRASSDKLGYSISGKPEDKVVTQSATYCDIVFTYDFKNRLDANGKKIGEAGSNVKDGNGSGNVVSGASKKVGFGESPNGLALEYFSLSFFSIDLAGNVNLSDEEYTKALNTKDIKVYSNSTSNTSTGVQLFNDLVNGTQSSTATSNSNCAYNPSTGQLDPSIFSADLASKLSDVILPRVNSSAFSCTVNIKYDAEAPLNFTSPNFGSNGVSTSGLGIRTAISNITSPSYKNTVKVKVKDSNGNDVNKDQEVNQSIPELANTEFNTATSNGKNTAITKDTKIDVTTTSEARADMVYSLQSGNADSNLVQIQSPYLNPNGLTSSLGLSSFGYGSGINVGKYKEYGTTIDIKSSKNQQSKQVLLKQDPSKQLLDPNTPFEWYYYNGNNSNNSNQKVESSRFSNTTRVIQNGEQDNPTLTTSFVLARNTTSTSISEDNKNKRDEDGTKFKNDNYAKSTSPCTATTSDAITTSGLGIIPATVNRKVGVCDDGLYKVNTYAVDTSGNVLTTDGVGVDVGKRVPVLTSKVLERDTVSPDVPKVVQNVTGDILGQKLSLKVNGEANTIATIVVNPKGGNSDLQQVYGYRLDSNGNFQTSNLLGQLTCETDYSIDVTLTDRAGNVSKKSNTSFNTLACPVCPTYRVIDKSNESITTGATSGKYTSPVRGAAAPSGLQLYGTERSFDGRTWAHEGVDFNGAGNPPAYSIGAGVVIVAGTTVYGNTVRIDHQNGTQSEYGHLDSIAVKKGDSVTSDTKIGIVGASGKYVQGAHLHLNVFVNGKGVNPLTVINSNYSYTPVVADSNSRYAVLQTSPGTLSIDEARRFGCDVPSLPADPAYVFGGGGDGGGGNGDGLAFKADNPIFRLKAALNNKLLRGSYQLKDCMNKLANEFIIDDKKFNENVSKGFINNDTTLEFNNLGRKFYLACYGQELFEGTNITPLSANWQQELIEEVQARINTVKYKLTFLTVLVGTINKNILIPIGDFVKQYWKEAISIGVGIAADLICTWLVGLGTAITGGLAAPAAAWGFTQCLAIGSLAGSLMKQILNLSEGKPIDFGVMAFDTALGILAGVLIGTFLKVVIPFIVNGVKYIVNRVGSKAGEYLSRAASKVCSFADGELTVPIGGLPDEYIPNNTRFPRGYDGSGKYLISSHPDFKIRLDYQEIFKKYPEGITFDTKGYPEFEKYAYRYNGKVVVLDVPGLTGTDSDFGKATKRAKELGLVPQEFDYKLDSTKTWEHNKNGTKMILIDNALHEATAHKGGASNIRNFLNDFVKACIQ